MAALRESGSPAAQQTLACSSAVNTTDERTNNCTKGLYVYGFDENPIEKNTTIANYFAAIKQQYPLLRTMSVLNWALPGDNNDAVSADFVQLMDSINLNTWVNAIDSYVSAGVPANWTFIDVTSCQAPDPTRREQQRRAWVAAGQAQGVERQYWWYWCAEPSNEFLGTSPVKWLNTWVERPSIQGRLLMWLAALHDVDGILYWATNFWSRNCYEHQRVCEPIRRVNRTMLTDYNPITWPSPWGEAAGERSFTCEQTTLGPHHNLIHRCFGHILALLVTADPGVDGPIATTRLKALRDGIEDVELFRKAGVVTGGGGMVNAYHGLITQLVTNFTLYKEDPLLLEWLRRAAAKQLVDSGR